jgi:ABC-2 type transport system permease protein
LAKLLQAILPNLALISLFALPVLYGLGAASGYNFLFYPFVLIVLSVFALAAAGISALLVMLLVRIIPPRRIAEVLGFVGAILAMVMSQIGNIFNFGEISPGDAQIQQTLSNVERFNTPWMPLTWGGRGLVSLGEGDWLPAAGFLFLTIAVSLGIFWLSLVTAERWFYSGWAGMQVISTKKKTRRKRSARRSTRKNFLISWISPNIRAIIRKDFLVLRRDLRNLSQLVTPLIFGVIYSFLLLRNGGEVSQGQGQAPTLFYQAFEIALIYSSVGIAIFVGWMLLARLATMSFSQEHQSYWILKSAPVSPRQLVTAKFLVSYIPTILLGVIFLTVITLLQRAYPSIWFYGLFVVLTCNAGLAGINIAFGIAGARFDWKDPRKMASSATGCFSSLASMAYIFINLVLFFAPPILFAAVGAPEIYGQFLGGMFGGLVSFICLAVPPWMVRNRIPLLAEAKPKG